MQDGVQVWRSTQDVVLIKGCITAPIQLDMSPPEPGSAASTSSTCRTNSPLWHLEEINYYNYSVTQKDAGPRTAAGLNMKIINIPAEETVFCRSVFGSDNYTRGIQAFQCWKDISADSHQPNGVGQLWTSVLFDERTFEFSMNQSWYCVDPDTQKTFVFLNLKAVILCAMLAC